LYDYCRAAPDRLIGVAMVPQRYLHETLQEAQRAVVELGFRGVILRPNPLGGRTLDHPAFEPLWSLLEALDVPLLIHEGTTQNVPQAGLDRYESFLFRHIISHPHEQQMAVLSLIAGGVLERHPRLRVAFLESGCGWLPYWLERIAEHLERWPAAGIQLSESPKAYFQRQCYITAEVEEEMLPAVIQSVGDRSILFASDYPHADAIFPGAVQMLATRTDLSEQNKTRILGENACHLFKLEVRDRQPA
jgi:predicted TIM-barrel fold metal-dependent hydrolase